MMDRLVIAAKALMHDEHVVEVAHKAAEKATYIAGGATVFSGLTINEWGVVIGATLGVLTFCAKIYFERQRLKILRERGE
jgi:hypothetical protein